MRLAISLPLRNQQQLNTLLQQLYDPASANYRNFLTVQQFTTQFGPTAEDYQKVLSFAKSYGLTVTRSFSNRLVVGVSGPVASVNQAFHVTMQRYEHPTEKRTFYAPDVEPTVDAGVPILSVDGLSDLSVLRSGLKRAHTARAPRTNLSGSGQCGLFLGSDMRAAYAPGVALDGSGQTVGLIELDPYNLSDVQMYFSTIGQPLNVPIYNVLLDVDGVCSGTLNTPGGCNDAEEAIDIEQAVSMAPNLSALIVYEAYGGSGNPALTAFTQAADDNVAKQLSFSFYNYGGVLVPSTEPGFEQVFKEFQAQGQSLFVVSGDFGADPGDPCSADVSAGCYPANSPNVTDVGGTDLTTAGAGGPWQFESGWSGSGGGWNTQSPIPSYQTPVINASNQGSIAYRNVPDVAMEANDDNYFCANGQCESCPGAYEAFGVSGTSLAAPRWAGFLALANQQANGTPVGFLNPTIYRLGQGSTYDTIFHDITSGNNFNSISPNLFSAVTGYDLVTGWGSPTGQETIDAFAPANTTGANFALTASPATLNLTPGGSGISTITVTPMNGFSGTIQLTVTVLGSPAGVTATLGQTSITGSGSTTLSVSTTSATPGGNLGLAVTGTGKGLTQTTYVQLALPDFSIAASPNYLYLNQSGTATSTLTVKQLNGFAGHVAVALAGDLPNGVAASVKAGSTTGMSALTLAATSTAPTRLASALAISGTSGTIQHTAPGVQLAVSAAISDCGAGVPVDLSSAYNWTDIYTDGTGFPTGGVAYSSDLLMKSRVLSGVLFNFGPPNVLNAVYSAGQTIPLPAGNFTTLQILGTSFADGQAAQTLTITYTDGTTSQFRQGFSGWGYPSNYLNETEAVVMPYVDFASGGKYESTPIYENGPFSLYGYTFVLNPKKTAKSVTLPTNPNVVVLAATITNQYLGTQVDLSSVFNVAGIYTDGTTFPDNGGLQGGGNAYSANLLGDQAGPSSLVANNLSFNLGPPNAPDATYGAGQAIPLPAGHFTELHLLATGVDGNQIAQTVTVTYTDGSTSSFTQNFSDWLTPQNYPGESAIPVGYGDLYNGTEDSLTFNLYEYSFALDPFRTVKTLELPTNRDVVVLAATLADFLRVAEPVCERRH